MAEDYRINYLEFPSVDGAATKRFFEAAFGWSFVDYGPTYQATGAAGIDAGIQSDRREATAAPLVIVQAPDLEAAQLAVERAGGRITRPAFDFPGGRRFHFREPGGNEMAVWVAK